MPDQDRHPRTLVLCFDGTADEFDGDNSNVVRFFSLLKKDFEESEQKQACYYQPGLGTYFAPGVVSPLLHRTATALDLATAWSLDAHIKDGYRFLMQNYHKGDKICLFGFSRGAYIARALAGFLTKCGLLLKDNQEQIAFAYKLYARTDPDGQHLASRFKEAFCRDVHIEFLGVWDTVASVGFLRERTLPFTESNHGIKTFRHALALDEHRGKFRPNTWQRPPVSAARRSMAKEKSPRNSPQHAYTGLPRPSTTSENTLGLTLSPKDVPPPPLLEQDTTLVNNPPLHPMFLRSSLDSRDKTPRSSSQTGRPESLRLSETGDSLVGAMLSGDSSADPNRTFAPRTTPASAPPTTSTSIAPNLERSRSSGDRFSSLIRKHSDKLKSRISYLASATKHVQDEGTIIVEPDPDITWPETDVLEVWFAGSHSDVGGGNVKNGVRNSLANITLRWMVREVTSSQCGILFDRRALDQYRVQKDLLGSPRHIGGREKVLDMQDIKSPIVDRLRPKLGLSPWWLTEFLPIHEKWQDESGGWHKKWSFNIGRGRHIRRSTDGSPLNIHFTVRERMESLGYKPKAYWSTEHVNYVE